MKIIPPQVAAIAFMMGYTIFGLICVYLVYTRINCNSTYYFTARFRYSRNVRAYDLQDNNNTLVEPPQALFEDRYCAGSLHGFFSSLSTFVVGYALVIYRVLNGFRTRFVKVVHAFLHGVALFLFLVGYYFYYIREYDLEYDRYHFHAKTSLFVGCLYLLQLAVALAIFLSQRNVQVRLMFAPFHDVFGIWLLIGLVGCCLSGKRCAHFDYAFNNQWIYFCLTFVSYSIALIVILNPYFEWDLVGSM